ncbi:hypothetical protein AN401_12720 [Zobellella denitrificans]|uniref:Uncharacterized protein n=1 Tax=Zobellella denitrificans TaxID=347534 RepID=A0A291HR26_9GAMM|nr:hypothetical protein AN401_12720 [Zobellella denitrificans]
MTFRYPYVFQLVIKITRVTIIRKVIVYESDLILLCYLQIQIKVFSPYTFFIKANLFIIEEIPPENITWQRMKLLKNQFIENFPPFQVGVCHFGFPLQNSIIFIHKVILVICKRYILIFFHIGNLLFNFIWSPIIIRGTDRKILSF